MPLGMEVAIGPGDFVLDGDPALYSPKTGGASKFSAHVYCGQTAGWINMVLGTEVGLSPGDFVCYMEIQPSPKRERSPPPQFSAHFYCGQTAGCIKMQLGMEVGLSPGDLVLDGDPLASPKMGRSPPIFGPCLLQPNGYIDQDATWYGDRTPPRRYCVRWGPSCPPPKKGRSFLPNFRPMSIVTKRLDGSR